MKDTENHMKHTEYKLKHNKGKMHKLSNVWDVYTHQMKDTENHMKHSVECARTY